jgi:RNA polymerase sigma-70 factor (ECF subfamily)
MKAWEEQDVETVVEMLAEDATFGMPPLGTWFGGRDEIEIFLRGSPLSGTWDWKPLRVKANGQEALAFYQWDADEGAHTRFALNVLTFRGEEIADVTAFITTEAPSDDREVILRMPEHPYDEAALDAAFDQFGLPERLD